MGEHSEERPQGTGQNRSPIPPPRRPITPVQKPSVAQPGPLPPSPQTPAYEYRSPYDSGRAPQRTPVYTPVTSRPAPTPTVQPNFRDTSPIPPYRPSPATKPARRGFSLPAGAFTAFAVVLVMAVSAVSWYQPASQIAQTVIAKTSDMALNGGVSSEPVEPGAAIDAPEDVSPESLLVAISTADSVVAQATGVDTTVFGASLAKAKEIAADPARAGEIAQSYREISQGTQSLRTAIKARDYEAMKASVMSRFAAGEFSTGDRMDDARRVLEAMGFTGFTIKEQTASFCGDDRSIACVPVFSPYVVYLTPELINDKIRFDEETFFYTLIHEFAHTVHIRQGYDRVFNLPEFASFGADPEYLAECMAQTFTGIFGTTGYDYTCTDEQFALAQKVWIGDTI